MTLRFILVALLLGSGCSRSVTLRTRQLSELRVEGASAHAVYRDGHTLTVDKFHRLTVETREKAPPSTETDPDQDVRKKYAFRAPVVGALTQDTLDLRDRRGHGAFARGAAYEVKLSKRAPERGIAIGAVTLVTALVGGVIGASSGDSGYSCDPDIDRECDFGGLGGIEEAFRAVLGAHLGAAVGLVISLPLTIPLASDLGTTQAAPRAAALKR